MDNHVARTESQDVEGLEQSASILVPNDLSAGDVIAAHPDGTIVLDDGITTHNTERAAAFLAAQPTDELRYAVIDNSVDPELFALRSAKPGDAGFDLRACLEDGGERNAGIVLLASRNIFRPQIIGTGIAVEIPVGYAGLVLPRSGLAFEYGVTLANSPGLIDSGYRGEIKLAMTNHGSYPLHVQHGDRIAQLLIVPAPVFQPVRVDALSETERGEDGFGSTGVA